MGDPVRRGEIATAIHKLIAVNGATHITITMTATDAEELAKDLRWACKTTVRSYHAEKVEGSIE